MSYGGMETFIMAYLRNMDVSDWKIDIVEHGEGEGVFDKELVKMGCRIFHVTPRSVSLARNMRDMTQIMQNESYDIVWSHMDAANFYALKAAKKAKVPVRISHSHNTQYLTRNKIKKANLSIIKRLIPMYATHLFACSDLAGIWLYGKMPFTVIPNAIEFEKFCFNQQQRKVARKELGVSENTFIIGHIGRFDFQKNHPFLIEIFKALLLKKQDSKLLLIGDGSDIANIQALVKNYQMDEEVIFLGHRTDIPTLLSAMDCFVLPSHFEGLGIVLLEAQANGLPCIVSNVVPKEVDIQGAVTFIDLAKPPQYWVDVILEKSTQRNCFDSACFKQSEFEIKKAARKLKTILYSSIHDKEGPK